MKNLSPYIEHTNLRPDATRQDIEKLCQEALEHRFYAVCVNGGRVEEAFSALEDSQVKVVAVAGFPLGAMDSDVKRYEAETAIDQGAHEIDMVLNIGRVKEKDERRLLREIRDMVDICEERPLKVIVETGLLTREEIILACQWAVEGGAQFVKTSTGFGPRGASVDDVKVMRETVGPKIGIKASAGIRDAQFAWKLIEAGATRLGTSAGVQLLAASPAG